MPTIYYTEPDTGIRYTLTVTDDEVLEISKANPLLVQRIILPETGGFIDFKSQGKAILTSTKSKHSFANSSDIVISAKQALVDDTDA